MTNEQTRRTNKLTQSASTEELVATGQRRYVPNYAPKEMILDRGEGARFWDLDGNEYVDLGAGISVTSLGHGDPELAEALAAQAGRLWHVSNLYFSEPVVRLAEELCEASFADRVFFCNFALPGRQGFGSVEDDDFPATLHRSDRQEVFRFAHLLDADAGRHAGVAAHCHDIEVGVHAAPNAGAGLAEATGAACGGGIGNHQGRLPSAGDGAVDSGGQVQGQGHFADAGRAGQQVGMAQAPGLQAGVQLAEQVVLADGLPHIDLHPHAAWIPAFAGMTVGVAGMTGGGITGRKASCRRRTRGGG